MIAHIKIVAVQHLLLQKSGVARTGVHHRISGSRINFLYGHRDNILFFVLILLNHDAPLGLSDALNDHLLCNLCGNPAKVFGLHLNLQQIAHIQMPSCMLLCFLHGEFGNRIGNLLHHRHLTVHMECSLFSVNGHPHIVAAHFLLHGTQQCCFHLFQHVLLGNAFLSFQILQSRNYFVAHFLFPFFHLTFRFSSFSDRSAGSCSSESIPSKSK